MIAPFGGTKSQTRSFVHSDSTTVGEHPKSARKALSSSAGAWSLNGSFNMSKRAKCSISSTDGSDALSRFERDASAMVGTETGRYRSIVVRRKLRSLQAFFLYAVRGTRSYSGGLFYPPRRIYTILIPRILKRSLSLCGLACYLRLKLKHKS